MNIGTAKNYGEFTVTRESADHVKVVHTPTGLRGEIVPLNSIWPDAAEGYLQGAYWYAETGDRQPTTSSKDGREVLTGLIKAMVAENARQAKERETWEKGGYIVRHAAYGKNHMTETLAIYGLSREEYTALRTFDNRCYLEPYQECRQHPDGRVFINQTTKYGGYTKFLIFPNQEAYRTYRKREHEDEIDPETGRRFGRRGG